MARPPDQRCKGDGWPNDRDIEPVNHFRSQAPRSTKDLLQAHKELWPFFTLIFPCSRQVSREFRITPRYLTDSEQCRITPKVRGSKEPESVLFLINMTSLVLSGLADKPTMPHHISTVWTALCVSSDTVFGRGQGFTLL
jgi:hypothetical protein